MNMQNIYYLFRNRSVYGSFVLTSSFFLFCSRHFIAEPPQSHKQQNITWIMSNNNNLSMHFGIFDLSAKQRIFQGIQMIFFVSILLRLLIVWPKTHPKRFALRFYRMCIVNKTNSEKKRKKSPREFIFHLDCEESNKLLKFCYFFLIIQEKRQCSSVFNDFE